MPALEKLLRRWGFVKLRSYGLVLTPEGRIVSTRPTLLDDGSGGRVVGWKDNDLAAMELGTMDVRPLQVAPPLPPRLALPSSPPPIVLAPPKPAVPVAKPPQPVAEVVVAAPPPIVRAPSVVEADPDDDEMPEDDWEWVIAIARARAAADAVEDEVRAVAPIAAEPERRRRGDTVPPPAVVAPPAASPAVVAQPVVRISSAAPAAPVTPIAAAPARTQRYQAVAPKPVGNTTEPLPAMDTTEAFTQVDEDDATEQATEVVRVVRIQDRPHVLPTPVTIRQPAASDEHPTTRMSEQTATAVRRYERARSPVTVIPVPKLPRASEQSYRPDPVVRSTPTSVPVRARSSTTERLRMAKGTGPLGDQTSPGIGLPSRSITAQSPAHTMADETSPYISVEGSGRSIDEQTRPSLLAAPPRSVRR